MTETVAPEAYGVLTEPATVKIDAPFELVWRNDEQHHQGAEIDYLAPACLQH